MLMNIFILDEDPILAARDQCDKHVVKMVLESAQLLCSPFDSGTAPYKRTHYNHPCSKWAQASSENFDWLALHALALCEEYTYRYKKIHKSEKVINWCIENKFILSFANKSRTAFALAMPDKYKSGNAVESYRAYYSGEKATIAVWNKTRKPPLWWTT